MKILLDTNAYTALMEGHTATARHVRGAEGVVMSAVVVGELFYGFRHGSRFGKNRQQLEGFLRESYVDFLPVTMLTCERFSMVAAQLRRAGTPIPSNDIWISAHALETGAHVVSFDSHFESVAGLALVTP